MSTRKLTIRGLKLVESSPETKATSGDVWLEPRDLSVIDILGKGNSGQVWKVSRDDIKDKDGGLSQFAAKAFRNSDKAMEAIKNETRIIRKVEHQNIVKCFALYENQDFLFAIFELAEGGNLARLIKTHGHLQEKTAASITIQLLHALAHIHGNGVMHRDVKPGNVMFKYPVEANNVSTLKVLLSDFGTAIENETSNRGIGTPKYAAPELLRSQQHTSKVDMWSLGAVVYEMLCGEPPFIVPEIPDARVPMSFGQKLALAKQLENFPEEPVTFQGEIWKDISDDAQDFIRRCLNKDPVARISSKKALKHKWVQNNSNGKSHTPGSTNNRPFKNADASGSGVKQDVNPSSNASTEGKGVTLLTKQIADKWLGRRPRKQPAGAQTEPGRKQSQSPAPKAREHTQDAI